MDDAEVMRIHLRVLKTAEAAVLIPTEAKANKIKEEQREIIKAAALEIERLFESIHSPIDPELKHDLHRLDEGLKGLKIRIRKKKYSKRDYYAGGLLAYIRGSYKRGEYKSMRAAVYELIPKFNEVSVRELRLEPEAVYYRHKHRKTVHSLKG